MCELENEFVKCRIDNGFKIYSKPRRNQRHKNVYWYKVGVNSPAKRYIFFKYTVGTSRKGFCN